MLPCRSTTLKLVVQAGEAIGQGMALLGAVSQGMADTVGERTSEVGLIEDALTDDRGQGRLAVQGALRLCLQVTPEVADGKVRH